MRKISLIFLGFTLSWGLEYRFNQIGGTSHGPLADNPFFIGDTDSDGLNEIIFYTESFDHHERRFPPWEIWEHKPGNVYTREYIGPPQPQESFLPYAVGDIDKDGLSDIMGEKYFYDPDSGDVFKIIMLESPAPNSHPTEAVWEVKFRPIPEDSNFFWWGRPLIVDIDRDGRNEYIIPFVNIYVAKCTGDNKIEFVDSILLKVGEHIMDWSSILGDFDQDGKINIASGGEGGGDWQLEIYENTIGYRFENTFRDSVPPFRGNAKVFSSEDSDGDGKPEVFLDYGTPTAPYIGVAYLYRWEAIGDNKYSRIFIDSARADSGVPWGRSACGDVDGDGIEEIIWSIGTDVYVYKSTGNDKYEKVWHWIPPYYKEWDPIYTQVKVYDMNKNGYGEIIISFYRRYGGGSHVDTIQIFEIDTTCLAIVSKPPIFRSPDLSIFPNPFKTVANIKYQVASREPINLEVYNATGRLVRILLKAKGLEHRAKSITWDGRDENREPLSAGIYFLKLKTASHTLTKKIVLMR